jgi:lysophospholipase L1-like esterase
MLSLSSVAGFAQNKREIHVIYIGDSITQGVQMDNPVNEAPPALANAFLQGLYRDRHINFSNQGHSGYTTVDFLPGTEAFNQAEKAANGLPGRAGSLVFSIMLGTNDSAIKGTNGAPVSPDSYFNNLHVIISKLLQDYPGCIVIINHPIWYSPNTYNGAEYLQEGLDRLQSYFPEIEKLVNSYHGSRQGRVFIGDTDAFNYFKETHLTTLIPENGHQGVFYLHPNQKGAKILGEFWAKAIYRHIGPK